MSEGGRAFTSFSTIQNDIYNIYMTIKKYYNINIYISYMFICTLFIESLLLVDNVG